MKWVVTGTSMVVEADTADEAVSRAQDSSGWHWEAVEWSATNRWFVQNNITGGVVSKGFDSEDKASRLCYEMNLQAGPGGLYGVGSLHGTVD